MNEDARQRVGITCVALLAAALLLPNLDGRLLWQDEAQTALIARSILSHGVPMGHDGRNSFSQELGVEYGEDGIWRWHTWLSFYLEAGSLGLLGADTAPARLPFALCGLTTVVLTWLTGLTLWRDRSAALFAALLLSLSVPFLIFSRQARYYALASMLSLLGLLAYTRLGRGARDAPWLLFGSATLLFHTHYVYAATLLATLLLHAALLERSRLRATLVVSAAVTLQAVPWIAWFSTLRLTPQKLERLLDLADTADQVGNYLGLLFGVLFAKGAFLLLPLALALTARLRREKLAASRATWSGTALLALYCAVTILTLSLLSPLAYVRYLAPLLPPLFLLAGRWTGALWRVRAPAALAVVAAFAGFGALRHHVYELTHDHDGPIEGIVRFLGSHARPDETVAIVYGDLPLKFYTDLRVVGGLTGEDLEPERGAEWIVPRRHVVAPINREVRATLEGWISADRYLRHVLAYPDVAFENREDPRVHRFRTEAAAPPVVVWERPGR